MFQGRAGKSCPIKKSLKKFVQKKSVPEQRRRRGGSGEGWKVRWMAGRGMKREQGELLREGWRVGEGRGDVPGACKKSKNSKKNFARKICNPSATPKFSSRPWEAGG